MVDRYLDLPLLQNGGNLGGPVTGDAQTEYLPDHLCGLLVHDPVHIVLRVLQIAVRRIRAERLSGLSFCLEYGTDFLACILCIPFVYDVLERSKFVLTVITVNTIIDCDKSNIMFWEQHLGVISRLQILSA